MNNSYIFRWGADTYIMNARWGCASSKIMVNGREIYGCVGEYNHSPRKAAQHILEMLAKDDGLDINSETTINKIQNILNGLD